MRVHDPARRYAADWNPMMAIDVTVAFGMPGSASTWVYNVVRELRLIQHQAQDVESFYSDAVGRVWQVFRENHHMRRHVVWKLHEPDENWAAFLAATTPPLVLSFRDPRDAMLSLMERFGQAREPAFNRIMAALTRIVESAGHPHAGLRYEHRFFEQPETVGALAEYLGITITDADRDRIFTTYATETVKRFGQGLDNLPTDRVRRIDGLHYDEVTQIHQAHIGDQLVGKWRDRFDAAERQSLNARFRPFLDAFGYDLD